jgi:PmbA protein
MSDLLDMAKKTLALAKQKGADEATASAYRSREVEVGWRDGKVEKVTEATTRGVSLSVYVGHRYSSVSTSDLRDDALAKFVEDTIAMARTLTPDRYRSLPDAKLYEGRFGGDLQLRDPSYGAVSAQQRRDLAKQMEDAARAAPGADKILSVTSSVSDSETTSARVTSNGFEGEISRTSYWLSAEVSVKDPDGRRPEDYDYAGARFFSELPNAAQIGKNATARALTSIGAKKVASAEMTMVVENRVAGRLLGAILGPLGGRSLQQKQSFLEGKIKQPIASALLTLVDDPHVQKGFGSRLWDGDGFAAKKMSVIDRCVLQTYYVDDYYGRKLGMPATTGSSSNLVMSLGTKDLEALVKGVKDGVLVTSFLGGNSNSTTGDYSFGVQGFRVRNGARAEAVSEMNVSGNQLALWKHLSAVGNDPYAYSATRTPTLVFDAVQFAGT